MIFTLQVTSPDVAKLQEDILKDMKNACFAGGQSMRDTHAKIVGNWRGKPEFRVYAYVASRSRAEARVTIGGVNKSKWYWVSNGVEARTVFARSKGGMRFPYQGVGNSYLPKTTPNSFGGPGQRVGPMTRRYRVFRGIKARNFPGLARKIGENALWAEFGRRLRGG